MFENFAHNLGISLELQAFTIIKEIKKIMIHSRSGRGQRISKGGGARFRILLCPTQGGPNRVQGPGQGYNGKFSRGAQARPEGPRLRGMGYRVYRMGYRNA